jgi:serine/threonine protein kinase
MPFHFSCAQGHKWDAPANGKVTGTVQRIACPECAGGAITLQFQPETQLAHDDAVTLPPGDQLPKTVTLQPRDDTFVPAIEISDVPGYEILEELGRGGMGVVYKARQIKLNRMVALKMILSGEHAGADQLERFRIEAEAVARLQHPNIVQIFEVSEHNGLPYFSLEFVDGGSLADDLDGTPWPVKAAAKLVEELALAVQAAHDKNIVHRDLKPGNILLTRERGPKISDFGLAKRLDSDTRQTQSGAIVGTPSYMAPEQAGGTAKDIGPPADVYALGAILYELLTGRPPFKAETALDTVFQVLYEQPVPPAALRPKLPRDLATICTTCLRKQPGDRYATARDLADDLGRFLAGRPIRARAVGFWEAGWRLVRQNPGVAFMLTLVLVGMVVTGLWCWQLIESSNKLWRQNMTLPGRR